MKGGAHGEAKTATRRQLLVDRSDETKWLLLRTDLLLMPLMTFAYGMQYYDKAILATATLYGILDDLKLTSERYSTASACFYYGFLAGAFPMSVLVQRYKGQLNYVLGGCIILWGVLVMLTCVVSDYRGLYAQRIFLGFVEASVPPGFVAVTRMWYTKRQQPLRLGIWWSAVGLFLIVSGVINHRLGSAETSLAPWKLLFLVPGTVTIVFGLVIILLLPPTPLRPPVLPIKGYNKFTETQRLFIDSGVRANLTGNERAGSPWSWTQAREAMRDPNIPIFFFMATAIYISNGVVTVFGPLLIKAMGYTSLHATILQTPGGATAAVSIWFVSFFASRKWLVRTPFARTAMHVASCLPVIAGCVMCWRGDWNAKIVPLIGYYLVPIFGAPFVMMLGSCTANTAGSTKQAIASTAVFLGYNCGNIISSYILVASERREHYPTTFKIVIGCMGATMFLAILQGILYARENTRRDRLYGKTRIGQQYVDGDLKVGSEEEHNIEQEIDGINEQDQSDQQNKQFRYIY